MLDGMLGDVSVFHLILLPLIGAVGGVIAGMIGSGGGVLVVPMLVYFGGVRWEAATGISAAQYFFGAMSGVVPHWRRRNVYLRVGVAMMVTGVVFAQLGAVLSALMPEWTLSLLYLFLAVVAATSLLFPTREERAGTDAIEMPRPNWLLIGGMGMLVGLVDGILGVGGGFMLVPLMVFVLQMPTRPGHRYVALRHCRHNGLGADRQVGPRTGAATLFGSRHTRRGGRRAAWGAAQRPAAAIRAAPDAQCDDLPGLSPHPVRCLHVGARTRLTTRSAQPDG